MNIGYDLAPSRPYAAPTPPGGTWSECTTIGTEQEDYVRVHGQSIGPIEPWRTRPIWQVITDGWNVQAWGLTYVQAIDAAHAYAQAIVDKRDAQRYEDYILAHIDAMQHGRLVFGSVPHYNWLG